MEHSKSQNSPVTVCVNLGIVSQRKYGLTCQISQYEDVSKLNGLTLLSKRNPFSKDLGLTDG